MRVPSLAIVKKFNAFEYSLKLVTENFVFSITLMYRSIINEGEAARLGSAPVYVFDLGNVMVHLLIVVDVVKLS